MAQISPQPLFAVGPQTEFDLFPASHGFTALQQVSAYGAGLGEIGFRLTATLHQLTYWLDNGILANNINGIPKRARPQVLYEPTTMVR